MLSIVQSMLQVQLLLLASVPLGEAGGIGREATVDTQRNLSMHIIAYYGAGCSGSTYTTHMLKRLLTHNGHTPCKLDGEVLKPKKFATLVSGGDPNDKINSVIRYCQGRNATSVVFDVTRGMYPDLKKYEEGHASLPVYKFVMYRSNLLYLKLCAVMDFAGQRNELTYVVRNGTRIYTSFQESRKRHGDVKVHLDPHELIQFINKKRSEQKMTNKEY